MTTEKRLTAFLKKSVKGPMCTRLIILGEIMLTKVLYKIYFVRTSVDSINCRLKIKKEQKLNTPNR